MKYTSFVTKILILLFVSVLFVAGFTNLLNGKRMISRYEEEFHKSNISKMESIKNEIEKQLLAFENTVDAYKLMTEVYFQDYPAMTPDMNELENLYEAMFTRYLLSEKALTYSFYIYFDPNIDKDIHDVWITRDERGKTTRQLEVPLERYTKKDNMTWFYSPKEKKTSSWIKPYYNRYNQYISSYVAPLFSNDIFLGIIGMYLDLDHVTDLLATISQYEGDMFWLYNEEEEIIYHSEYESGTPIGKIYDTSKDTKLYTIRKTGVKSYYSYEEKLRNGWHIAYSIPTERLKENTQNFIRDIILILVIAFLLLALGTVIYLRNYRRLFAHIIEVLNEVKKGNLEKRITNYTKDEIGIMAVAINESNGNLQKSVNEKNRLAYFDTVTSLPNKNSLTRDLSTALNMMRKSEMALAYVIIDNFRSINELLGYEQSSEFVESVARQLSEFTDDGINLYHIGIDEFAFFVQGSYAQEAIDDFIQKIVAQFNKNYTIGYHRFYLTVSVGCARYTDEVKTVSDFYQIADIAINEAIMKGRNSWVMYDQSLYDKLVQYNTLEQDFRKAIKDEEFLVYYQPQFDVESETFASAEALIRWNHPKKGILYPGYFISYAEKSGLITKLGSIVLKQVCHQIKEWEKEGVKPVKVAVNISKREIVESDFVDKTIHIIKEADVLPSLIEFEITESLMTTDLEETVSKLKELRNFGISISLDDFGTGYSSFNSIQELPLSIIKIDKSLIDQIFLSDKIRIMVNSVIQLSHKLNLMVVAEGVESIEQHEVLRWLKCDMIQGYYYSKPLPIEELEKLYDKIS